VLERRLGREVPLGALLAGSTIGQIASALGSVPSGLLVKLREGDGTRQPLVLIHAISGTVFPFVPLAASLAAGREVHALQARGLLGDQPPHETLDSMAADYAREIRRVQPNGPYGILGWSFGCTVALAVARLLTLEGETVAPLVMVDGPAPIGRESPGENEQALRERFRAEVAALTAGSTGPLPALDEELLFRVFRANVGIAHGAPRQRAGKPDGLVGRYGGPVVLFRASEGSSATLEPRDLDWGLIQPEVTVVWLPGDHYSMLREPAVRSLAAAVDALLAPASGTPVPG
ncbi:MAG: alpha/beta fold hydrolase, partial [Candidatus Riflebacteria bacterium]|nr:alpha/beta fold hydrolase [Candidatus Riflebacteria bacterium]